MHRIARICATLVREETAATAVEYGLILALIVLAMIASLTNLASETTGMWDTVANKVIAATH